MFTRKRWVPPIPLSEEGRRITTSLQQYFLSLEQPNALVNGGNVYTPTLTHDVNVDTSTVLGLWRYFNTDEIVSVQGLASLKPLAGGTLQLGISLPQVSRFSAQEDGSGAAFYYEGPTIVGNVLADATNDRVTVTIVGAAAPIAQEIFLYVQFSYRRIL